MSMNQREPLFEDDDADIPATAWGIRMRLGRIKRIEEAQKKLEEQVTQAQQWFDERAQAYLKQIEYERGEIQNHLVLSGEKSVPTDLGTVSLYHGTKKHWPEPERLVEWAKIQKTPGLIKLKESPAMREIERYMQEKEVLPPDYHTEDYLSITIRPPKKQQKVLEQLTDAA